MTLRSRSALAASGLVPSEGRMLLARVLERDRGWLGADDQDGQLAALGGEK
jgi:hypothetical protein